MRSLTTFQKFAIVAIFIIIMGGAGLRLYFSYVDSVRISREVSVSREPDPVVQIHIKGAVERPGLYTLKKGSRVSDAVTAAGGFTKEARRNEINLASILGDGQEVIVPPLATGADARVPDTLPDGWTLDINTASAIDLELIPGIGPTLASRIVQLRQTRGPYNNIEEIKLVQGIGDWKFRNISKYLIAGNNGDTE